MFANRRFKLSKLPPTITWVFYNILYIFLCLTTGILCFDFNVTFLFKKFIFRKYDQSVFLPFLITVICDSRLINTAHAVLAKSLMWGENLFYQVDKLSC